MITCIDLNERFANDYRVRHEDDRETRLGHDPWHYVIRCDHGEIYPHGAEMLGAATNKRGPIAKRLAALRCVKVTQDADDGVNVVFHVDDFPAVAAVMRPKRRRRLSPEQRAECSDRLRLYHFPAAQKRAPKPLKSFPAA
jgi:hypothetical protein